MEQPEGERSLLAGHLVVIELRGIDRARSELVVDREGLEDGCEKQAHTAMVRPPGDRETGRQNSYKLPGFRRQLRERVASAPNEA